jgi:glycosyltransferase involved in cell wall biosynthesis
MNKGIEIAQGSYLTFAGSDDLYNRDHLKGLIDAMQNHPEAGMVFDNAALFHDSPESSAESLLIPEDIATKFDGQRVPFKSIFFNNWVLNTSMFVRRTVLDRVGTFKVEIPKTGDFHLIYRIGALFPVFFVNYVGTRIRCHPQSMMHREPYYEANVKCLEDIRDNYPEVQNAVGRLAFAKRLGRKYHRLARYYENSGDIVKARITYEKAFLTRPTRPWYYLRSLVLRDR